jgi:hypothetical protein
VAANELQSRAPVALTLAAATGLWGLHTCPMSQDDVFLEVDLRVRARHVSAARLRLCRTVVHDVVLGVVVRDVSARPTL